MLSGRLWTMKMACTRYFICTANATKRKHCSKILPYINCWYSVFCSSEFYSDGHTVLCLNVTSDTHSCMSVQLQKVKSQQKDFHHTSKLRVLVTVIVIMIRFWWDLWQSDRFFLSYILSLWRFFTSVVFFNFSDFIHIWFIKTKIYSSLYLYHIKAKSQLTETNGFFLLLKIWTAVSYIRYLMQKD
jgi:hypothetical protein